MEQQLQQQCQWYMTAWVEQVASTTRVYRAASAELTAMLGVVYSLVLVTRQPGHDVDLPYFSTGVMPGKCNAH